MKLLVCGASDIFFRRVLPTLPGLGVTAVEVASRSGRHPDAPAPWPLTFWDDPQQALARSDAAVVYVSTENSRHAALAMAALESGRHVIVDKPAFLEVPAAEDAVALAARRKLVVAEATVWAEHPRVAGLRRAFAEKESTARRLSVVFSFPPLAPGNFRYVPELGGGALFDLGPYAVSPGRVFFGAEPDEVLCRITARGPAVETAFSCLLLYPGGRSLAGTFGFDTGYVNRLDVLGPGLAASLDRAFTPPPGAALPLGLNSPAGQETRTFEPADAFAAFFRRAFTAIKQEDGAALAEDLLADARTLARLRAAASAFGHRAGRGPGRIPRSGA